MNGPRAALLAEAETDVQAILAYLIEEASDAVMERFARSLFRTASLLAEMPGIGRPCHLSKNPLIRRFPVKGFHTWLIFYRQTENGIDVLRVLSSRRDWALLFP